jgi:hypothetical protein
VEKIKSGYIIATPCTPWNTVVLEKLTSFQLDKNLPSFYGSPKFITAITGAYHVPILSYLDPVHLI